MKQRKGGGSRLFLIIGALLFLAFLIINPLVTVGAGQRAVLFSLSGGTVQGQLGEGTHLIVPFIQRPIFYDVRAQTYTMSAVAWEGEVRGDDSLTALTSDGQVVTIDLSVRYHVDANRVSQLHQRVGQDYANKIIRPAARAQARVVIAQFPVADVYAERRELIEQRLTDGLKKNLAANDIVLDEVLLRDIRFSTAYAQAIEQKQIAQQEAQRKGYELEKEKKIKLQKIIEAKGEARAIELKGQAVAKNARVVQYEYARKVAPNVSAIITDGRNVQVPFGAPPSR